MRRILVTGGAGFIGACYVRRAVRRGDRVVVLDNLSRAGSATRLTALQHELGTGAFEMTQASVTDADTVERCCRGVDVVLHLAGQVAVTDSVRDPRSDFAANLVGTFNVLEGVRAGAPNAVLVHASTNKVYGSLDHLVVSESETRYTLVDRPGGIDETEPLDPHTPYACSNAAADQYVRDYARLYGLRTVVCRQSCIYGPGQYGSEDQGWVAWLMRAALHRNAVTIFGDGRQVRDLLHVEDLLDAYDAATARAADLSGRAYNIGGGLTQSLSIWREFSTHLASLTGDLPQVHLAPWRPADQKVYVSDVSRAARELGWAPRTPLGVGLRTLHDWLTAETGGTPR